MANGESETGTQPVSAVKTITPERPEGKVELTWTNKHRRLITHEDPSAKPPYAWVPSSDFRVAEIRLLTEVARVGDPDAPNLLIRGDALHALAAMSTDGAGVPNLTNKVRLVYIDPPFNTGQAFGAYEDNLEKSIWLTMMRDRLRQIQPLLRIDGSVWVHCDDSMGAHLRILMDEVFGEAAFVATIVWQKRRSRENVSAIGNAHDSIHVFAPAGAKTWAKARNKLAGGDQVPRNLDNDPRGPWRPIPFTAPGLRPNQQYEITTPGGAVHKPSKGRHWSKLEAGYKELLADNRIYFGKDKKGQPVVKDFSDPEGLVPADWWSAEEVGDNSEAKKEILALFPDSDAFDTPKPERLMRRIIEVATNKDEWVLDCFAGSASTAAVAHKLGRRWATVEISRTNVEQYDLTRLGKVVAGEDLGGITDVVAWTGGGGFRLMDTLPSMFEVDGGITLLADWAAGGALAEAVAAQLGFSFDRQGPFCGRKGRTRLAVIDGLVNTDVADLLLDHLAEREVLMLCGTGMDPAVQERLTRLRPGSVAQLIPQAILGAYGRPRRWTPAIVRTEKDR